MSTDKPEGRLSKVIAALFVYIIFVLTPIIGHAADPSRPVFEFSNTHHQTGISGFSAESETIREPGNDAFLYGIEFDEVGDKPCFILAHWWRNTRDDTKNDFTTKFDICKKTVTGDQSLIFSNGASEQKAVSAIQACNNNKNNHRMKGVKLFGSFVDRNGDGKVTDISAPALSFQRPNCHEPFKAKRSCDDGSVAIGLVIEHTDDEITGLGLKCAKPVIKPVKLTDNIVNTYSAMEADIRVQTSKNGNTKTLTLAEAINEHQVAGATVVIIDNGKIALTRHYGMRDKTKNLPTNGDTFYTSASISKMIAGFAMAKAARMSHGPKLGRKVSKTAATNPDSLVGKWVNKQFKKDESDFPDEISVRRLMGHSAGLDTWGIGTYKKDNKTDMKTILLGDIFHKGVKPRKAPGIDWCYSGGGITVAEAMLETHSGRSAREFLNNEILEPYNMKESTANDADDSMTNLARGCSRGNCNSKPGHSEVKFAGGLLVHPEDYARLLTYIANDGKDTSGNQIIPVQDVQAILTPTYFKRSSKKLCAASKPTCTGNEVCINRKCIEPMRATCPSKDADFGTWYGMGVKLSMNDPFGPEGLPRVLEHGGANDYDDVATHFEISRDNKNGIVIMVNGEFEWENNSGATLGANALSTDIESAYDRNFGKI